MKLEFLEEAEDEAAAATAGYEQIDEGLGERFARELEATVKKIVAQPLIWNLRRAGHRRVNLPNFPYYIAYILRGDCVRIVAVGHAARRPGYFQMRLRRPPAR